MTVSLTHGTTCRVNGYATRHSTTNAKVAALIAVGGCSGVVKTAERWTELWYQKNLQLGHKPNQMTQQKSPQIIFFLQKFQ